MSHKIVKSSIGLTLSLVFAYVLSFAKESIIAYFYGVSAETDAYTIAIQIPVLLFAFVSVAINNVVIPIYSKVYYQQSEEAANIFVNKLLSLLIFGLLAFIIIAEVFAGQLVYIFAPGFSTETHDLATTLLRIVFPSILFTVIQNVYTAVLNVHKNFVAPSFAVYFLNIGLIGGILVLHKQMGIASACVGQLCGGLIQFSYLVLLTRKIYRFRPNIHQLKQDENLKQAIKMTGPVIWSISVAELNALVNRLVASFLFVGSVAALSYAQKVNTVAIALMVHVISTIIYPLYAESFANGNDEQLSRRVNLSITVYSLLLMPLSVGIFCLKEEIIQLAFGRGQFDAAAVNVTQDLLGFYCIGIMFMGLRETVSKVFNSMGDTRTTAINATIGVVLNIVLNVTLPFVMGVNGLALATSICAIFITSRLLLQLVKTGKVKLGYFFSNIWKVAIATFVMSLFIFVTRHFMLNVNYLLRMAVVTGAGVLTYLVAIMVLRLSIVDQIKSLLFSKNRNH